MKNKLFILLMLLVNIPLQMNGQQENYFENISKVEDVKIAGVSVKTIKESDLNKIYNETGSEETVFSEYHGVYYRSVKYKNRNSYRFALENGTCFAFYLFGSSGVDINGINVGDNIRIIENTYPKSYQLRDKESILVKLIGTSHYLTFNFNPNTKIIESITFNMY